ncbi:MAG: Fic family protein, partial [Candidatus Levybacteria bacterium]|nr:Fic family protein [Candidatus Levybacteria bacterium]
MINFSYTLSPLLQEHIKAIETLRIQLALAPLSPKTELRLRFEAMIGRIYWSVSLSGSPLTKGDIENLIVKAFPLFSLDGKAKRLTDEERVVIRYKKAHDYITHEWLVNPHPLRLKEALDLAQIVESKQTRSENIDLSTLFEYLHQSKDHPVIQAAIVQMQLICMRPFIDGNGRIARLLALLYLYKNGYDFRGLLVLEEYWRKDIASLEVIKDTVLQSNSLNIWLEYFSQGMVKQLAKSLQRITSLAFHLERNGHWQLTDRQRGIVSVLEFP